MRESGPPSGKKRQPAGECLQIGIWNQLGRSSSGRKPALLGGPKCQSQSPAWPLPLASLAKTFLASSGTAPEGAGCGTVSDMPGRLPGVSSASAFPLRLGPRPPWRGGADGRLHTATAWSWDEQLDGCSRPCAPSSLGAPGKEAHRAPRWGLPLKH